jgi:hypothetical protein
VGEDRLSLEVKTHGSTGFGSSAVAAIGTRQRRRVVAIIDLFFEIGIHFGVLAVISLNV